MKEMIYRPDREIEILDEGIIDGRQYYILSFGTHPCAYVKVTEEELKDKAGFEDWDIDCHGGVTFCSSMPTINADGTYVGWDYGHCDDYSGMDLIYPEFCRAGGKKWTTEEILEEVKDVIRQLNEM